MKKINLVFVLAIAFGLLVCASGVVSAKMIRVLGDYPIIREVVDTRERNVH